ncbi:MAG: phenylalanine--tRNA ligase subunit beta [Vigna little leaf phytoplasma]|nr:phenylalanine--tRNA ligase subunit beta [Vigna little leaf phytoplasma]
MIINEYILNKYLSIKVDNLDDFQSLINNHMMEVKRIEYINQSKNLIIGQIIKIDKIDYCDKLFSVQVNIGSKILSIVCNAKNLKCHKKVIVAFDGSYLDVINKNIREKNIAGIKSEGMLCSAKELGLNYLFLTKEEKEGILYLEDDVSIGKCALEHLALKGFILELSLTPERADYLSHIGFAQDLKAVLPSDKVHFQMPLIPNIVLTKKPKFFNIEILSPHCFEFHVGYLENVPIQTSPLWLRNILIKNNIEPVNNIQDILNLILIEYGIVLDVFEASVFQTNQIQIRNVDKLNEKFNLTKEKIICLQEKDLIITNNQDIISIAGIATHQKYQLKQNKQINDIILTVGYFKNSNIFQTSKRLNIKNEKTLRLSRGVDQSLIYLALKQTIHLIKKLYSKTIVNNIISKQAQQYQNNKITLSLDLVYSKIGIWFTEKEIIDILTKLDYQIKKISNGFLQVIAPSRRYDINILEDVISDLTRIQGYDRIPNSIYQHKEIKNNFDNSEQKKIRDLKQLLVDMGFYEIITYSLTNAQHLNLLPDNDYISIINPISYERQILRTNLVSHLIEVLHYNQKHHNLNNIFFEIAKVYYPSQQEELHLSLGLSGSYIRSDWFKDNHIDSSFFLLKGFLERIAHFFNVNLYLSKTSKYQILHPGQQANIYWDNQIIGFIGTIHPSLNNKYHLKTCFVLEIILEKILKQQNKNIKFQEIPKFPSVVRDLSFFIHRKYNFQEIQQTLQKFMNDNIIELQLSDLYQNNQLSTHLYSLSFRFTFNDLHKNLTKEKVSEIMKKIEEKLKNKYQVKIR